MKVTRYNDETTETLSVKELIEALKQMPQDLPVCFYDEEYDYTLIDAPSVVTVQKDRWGNFNDIDEDYPTETEQAVTLFHKR